MIVELVVKILVRMFNRIVLIAENLTPHLTNEETMLDQEEKKQKRLDRIVGCFLWVFIAVIVFLLHFFVLRFLFPQKG